MATSVGELAACIVPVPVSSQHGGVSSPSAHRQRIVGASSARRQRVISMLTRHSVGTGAAHGQPVGNTGFGRGSRAFYCQWWCQHAVIPWPTHGHTMATSTGARELRPKHPQSLIV